MHVEIKLLKKGYYNNETLYEDFLNDNVDLNKDYFSEQVVRIKEAPDFPIYMATRSDAKRKKLFLQAFKAMDQYYVNEDREITFDGTFWHSLLITKKRDYILTYYPQVKDSFNNFRNVVTKPFNWESYIYKCLVGAQYIHDHTNDPEEKRHYYEMIIDNLDLFNYIIKHEISRNGPLLINILDIIDELDLSVLLKSKIKGREDLGDDERYGRRVMFEFNKSYPIIMTPMLEKEQLKDVFLEFLGYYYDVSEIRQKINYSDLTTNEKHQSLYAVTTINRPLKSEKVATDKSDYE